MDAEGHSGELDCSELKELIGVKDTVVEEDPDIWLDALSDIFCNADVEPIGVVEGD